jgi:hypothetical protein
MKSVSCERRTRNEIFIATHGADLSKPLADYPSAVDEKSVF